MLKEKYLELENWFNKEGNIISYKLMEKWRGKIEIRDAYYIFARALFNDENIATSCIKGNESLEILFNRIDKKYSDLIEEAKQELNEEELKAILLNFDKSNNFYGLRSGTGFYLQKELINLIFSLLDIKEEDNILEAYSQTGDFLVDLISNYPNNMISGIEIMTDNVLVSEIKASLIENNNLKVYQGEYLNFNLSEIDFNKFFSIPPMGYISNFSKDIIMSKELIEFYDDNKFDNFNDWANILKLISTKKLEKAVIILPSGLLFNERDKKIRKYLLENNFIEGIISLPSKILPGTSISTNILILSQDNKYVKMVDASNLYKKDRMVNTIENNHLEQILMAYQNETEISTKVSLQNFEENNYSLIPKRYTSEDLNPENYVYLEDVAKIKRGHANLKQADLDERISEFPTEIKIITAGDIDENFTFSNLKSLKNIEDSEDVYCVKDGEILFARGGTYKSLLIRNSGENKIIVNGTLYIITCNEEKINPYFLQMYLASEHCMRQIETLNEGTVINFMSIKKLGELKIPKLNRDLETEIADKYKTILDKKELIRLQNEHLDKETNELISEVL